jgi:RHS repeat-associated protein
MIVRFPSGLREMLTLDERHRPVAQELRNGAGDLVTRRFTVYGGDGELTAIDDALRGRSAFGYDSGGRLTSVRGTSQSGEQEDYTFDAAENASRGPGSWTFDAADRLIAASGVRFSYDDCGNRISRLDADGRATRYDYDEQGQLLKVSGDSLESVQFEYDGLGRRVLKRTGAKEIRYAWLGDLMIAEFHGESRARYFIYYPNSYHLLGWIDLGDHEPRTYFAHLDHRGTPNEITDEEGRLVWAPVYDAYGRIQRYLANEVECPLRSLGQYCDPETGLYYNRYRYFDPDTMRYLTPDPLGLKAGLNPYKFTADPLMKVDPWGLAENMCFEEAEAIARNIYQNSPGLQMLSRVFRETDPARQRELLREAERMLARDHGIVTVDWRGDETFISGGKQREPGAEGDRGAVVYDQRIIMIGEDDPNRRATEVAHEAGAILTADRNPPSDEAMAANPDAWKESIAPVGPIYQTHVLDHVVQNPDPDDVPTNPG